MDNTKAGSFKICYQYLKQKGSLLSQTAHYPLKNYQLSINALSITQLSLPAQYQISVPVLLKNGSHP